MPSLQVQLIDKDRSYVSVDPVNHALYVNDVSGGTGGAGGDLAIEGGYSFTHSANLQLNNDSLTMRLVVTNATHLVLTFNSEEIASCELFEGSTFSGNGTQKTPINRDRSSSTVATTTVWDAPTASADGTSLWQSILMRGNAVPYIQKFILDAGEYYVVLSDLSDTTNWASLIADFYEPDLA